MKGGEGRQISWSLTFEEGFCFLVNTSLALTNLGRN